MGSSEHLHASLSGALVISGLFDTKHEQFSIANRDIDMFLGSVLSIWEKPSFISLMMHSDDMPLWKEALLEWQTHRSFPNELSLRLLDNTGHYHDVLVSLDDEPLLSNDTHILPVTFSLPVIEQDSCHVEPLPQSHNDYEIGLMSDYTTQGSVIEALKQEHQRANHYLDIAGVIMVTLDLDGNITLLNRFACELLGMEQEDALGLNWFDNFLPIGGRCIAQSAYNRLMSCSKIPNQKVEKPVITQTGDERLILWYNRVLEDAQGARIGILSSGTDITEQRLSEQTLLIEKSRLRTLIDSIPDLIFFKNSDAAYIGCNKAFEVFSNACEESIVGQKDADLFDDTTANGFQFFDNEMLHKQSPVRHDEWVTYPDGRRVLLDTLRIPLNLPDIGHGVLGVSRDITEHTIMSGQLSLVNAMVDHSLDSLICSSPNENFRIIYANSAAIKHFGVSASELYQTQISDWDPAFTATRLKKRWKKVQEKTLSVKTTHRLRNGEEVPVEVSSSPFVHQDKTYMITVFKDIRDRLDYENALKTAEHRSRLLLEHSNEGIFGLDVNGVTTFINPAGAMMLGYDPDELIGKDNHGLIHHSHADGEPLLKENCYMLMSIRDGESYRIETDVLWRKDNQSFPVEYWSSPIYLNEEIVGAVVTFHDISHRKAVEEQIKYLAFHDSLTGLPNRRLFLDRFEHELLQGQRHQQTCALLMMDLDHFKEINDTLGHPAGDQLLIEVASRIKGVLRACDTFARFGGDEFTILQSNVHDPSDVAILAEKVISCFDAAFDVGGHKLKTNTSVGIVVCDSDDTVDELISRADVALYRAKEQGRGRFVFYQAEMTERVQKEAELAHMLSSARFLQQLYMVYQPQFDCESGLLVGFEALLRWEHPEQGLISPLTFIPVAEKRGMIDDIGIWVAQHVCLEVGRWLEDGLSFGTVSFNISPVQLRSEKGVECLLSLLKSSGIPLHHFEVEITESACMDASDNTIELLESYVNQGLKIAIDDFGTGYSSMVTLRKLSACRLKIDRSFIRDMLHNTNDEMIVKATIALAQSLGLEVVAEGVESKEQLAVLKNQGCDFAQGYYLGFPMKSGDTINFLRLLDRKTVKRYRSYKYSPKYV
ncbi:EAL domain-containing protein [Neptunomonas japonica]|uniref:Signal transduction protein n=1 Tax=Neptunomonas japonica JAMM 1380 TaxID=1441457 RepID=A0A7R6SVC2_9GAMM|nr:EAL domain-containing protein [Neptunomonas japonica]BBB29275.1 signal transduction protein [Neptunomonas japonica JAMM 1380]